MKTNRRARNSSSLSSARWGSYFAAATATAISGAHSASGEIHYSGLINGKFQQKNGYETHSFPLSQGASLAGLRYAVPERFDSSATFLIMGAAVSNAFRRPAKSSRYASSSAAALPRGAVISQGDFGSFGFFGTSFGRLQDYNCDFPGWQAAGVYYIGFRFNNGAGTQYGWVRIKWLGCNDAIAPNDEFVVKDYAWGDPGDKITAGQKRLKDDAANFSPAADEEPKAHGDSQGSLGLLALGAMGLRTWREKRRREV